MLDHFRVAIGGSKVLEVNAAMADLLQLPSAKRWRLKLQVWPRDLDLKRNMVSSAWQDVETLIASKQAQVAIVGDNGEEEAGLDPGTVIGEMKQASVGAAIRFAAVIGGDQRLTLALQGLPATADYLMGRPAFRG
jgi:hypothetical protein